MAAFLLLAAVTDVWAGLATHPAVVNPVSYEKFGRPETVISLAGEWDFFPAKRGSGHRTCRYDQDLWAKSPKRRKVAVPGCWEASGVGEAGMGIPYLCADNAPADLRHMFVGEGWYRTHVVIPADWHGKRTWLKCGGVKSQGWFYVNDRAVAWLDSGNGDWKWDVTAFVRPGETNKIVAVADNAVAARGGPSSGENRYGGLWRDVELEVTPEVCIDDAWVRGDFDARTSGFNFVRQHTHADAPEYMEAADEVGLLVASEIPYYLDNPNDCFSYDPIRDVDDMIVAFRRYVSFAVLSFGNEGMLGPAANRLVCEHVKKTCPGLLVLAQDGGTYLCNHGEGCSDFCSSRFASIEGTNRVFVSGERIPVKFLSPLHFGIIKKGLSLPLEGFAADDCIMVGEGEKDAFVYLAAKTCADGRREVLVAGLDVTSETVEGKWLL